MAISPSLLASKSTIIKFTPIDLVVFKPVVKPDYDTEVLKPLHKAQAAKAEADAIQKAQEAAQAIINTQPVTYTTLISTPVYEPSNDTKMFIYLHESGNNPARWNSSGCVGLGQACPGSKLLAVCPNLDYACEDAFFTNYAISRYGSWQGAYQFWINHNWW